ncbi:MAG: MMPL family transporter [Treponema sp.]|nr:MMPL family transporter [Treponema sp.]
MNRPTFPLPEQPHLAKKLPMFWLVFHCGIFLSLAASLFILAPPRINTSLFDIIPVSGALKSAAEADAILAERNSRLVVILSANEDFAAARAGALEFYSALDGTDGDFESLSFWADETFFDRYRRFLHDYRFMLLDSETIETLESGGARAIATNALASVYSPFTLAPLDALDSDPFMLVERSMQRIIGSPLLSSGNVSVHDDVMAAQFEGNWYVLIRGSLSPAGLALTNRESAVKNIYETGEKLMETNPEYRFYYSGIPFHSYESSSSAQKEISLISFASFAAILIIFLYIFRSLVPLAATFLAVGLSLLTAFASAMLFLREVHILSFVFGTTLIGTCVDYSIHFIIHRNAAASSEAMPEQPSLFSLKHCAVGSETRRRVFRGIFMCLLSTTICFMFLIFTPFAILKQFAIFSITGLISSFLTVICILPHIKLGSRKISFPIAKILDKFPRKTVKSICLSLIVFSFAGFIILLFHNREKIKIENSLGDLYSMSDKLFESERINAQVLQHGNSGWYFIVSGDDPDELLQNEEELCTALDNEMARGELGSYMAISSFCPSVKRQRCSYQAAEKLLPLAESQFLALGFPAEAADVYKMEFAAAGQFLLPDDSGFPAELRSSLWIGKSGNKYYSCVFPLHASGEENFRAIASQMDNVFFVNKVNDIQLELDSLTRIMLRFFIIAFAVLMIAVKWFYTWKQCFRILMVPVFLALTVFSVLSVLNISVGFFTIVGLILVLGLGLDYIFYNCEVENRMESRGHTTFAIFLSFLTTAISFGALALSSFAPVHIFGVTVFSGICSAFIFSTLLSVSFEPENQRNTGSAPSSAE